MDARGHEKALHLHCIVQPFIHFGSVVTAHHVHHHCPSTWRPSWILVTSWRENTCIHFCLVVFVYILFLNGCAWGVLFYEKRFWSQCKMYIYIFVFITFQSKRGKGWKAKGISDIGWKEMLFQRQSELLHFDTRLQRHQDCAFSK